MQGGWEDTLFSLFFLHEICNTSTFLGKRGPIGSSLVIRQCFLSLLRSTIFQNIIHAHKNKSLLALCLFSFRSWVLGNLVLLKEKMEQN